MVAAQHGHVSSRGGQAADLGVQLQRCQLLTLTVHRHHTVLRAGTVPTQQQSGIAVAADADPPQIVSAVIIGGSHHAAAVNEAQLLLRHSAESGSRSHQIIDHAAPQGAASGLLITVHPVEDHIAGKRAVFLPHGHRRQGTAVGGQRRRHHKAVRRLEGEHRFSVAVIDPYRGLAAAFTAHHSQPALGIQRCTEHLSGAVQCVHQALIRQDVYHRSAHVIGCGTSAADGQRR